MPAAQDPEANPARLLGRLSMVVTAAMLGGVVLIVGILIGAFVVVDQRAAQAFKVAPRIAHGAAKRPSSSPVSATAPAATNTVGSGTSPGSPASRQAIAGDVAPAPDAILDAQDLTDTTRHGRKKHGRRFARPHARGHLYGFFAGRW